VGAGTTAPQPTPVGVTGMTVGVVAIDAGTDTTCAIGPQSAASCWGLNAAGQIGDGTTTNRSTPVSVQLKSKPEALSNNGGGGGNGHTCALLKTAKVVCRGDNYRGDLGDGTTSQRSTPVNVVGLSQSAVQVSAGADMTCALLSVGTVFCWGDNTFGQLGNGSAGSNITKPAHGS